MSDDGAKATGEARLAEVHQLPTSSIRLRELSYFVVLGEELHFGRAAERLHISQSPLSQTIAQFERKLGTRLLDRSTRHVELTRAGEVLLEHARRLLQELDDAIGATRRAGAGETGTLRLAVGPVPRDAVLPGLRHALDERLPALVVEVVEVPGDAIVDAVLHGAADAGLMLNPPYRDDIGTKVLRRDTAVAVVRRGHPLATRDKVTPEELAEHALIMWPRGVAKGAHDVVLALFHDRRPTTVRVADEHSGAVWEAMQAADGFIVLPASAAVSGDLARVPIDDGDIEFTMSLVWSSRTPPAVLHSLLGAVDAAIEQNAWA